jgi:NAD(P)-dependent dehydrogenase (short-subunit alcohol dehydrogenase family)
VVVNYHQGDESAHVLPNHIQDQGREAVLVKAQISDPSAMITLFTKINGLSLAKLDLVNNAGFVTLKAIIQELDPARFSAVVQVNIDSTIDVARHAMEYVRGHHGAGNVNVSSTTAR